MTPSQTNTDNTQKEQQSQETPLKVPLKKEIGGREGPEPTRFGDWELHGKCVDF